MEFYRKCPPRRVEDKKMTEIEITSFVRSVMKVTLVARIEREHWVAAIIIRRVNDGVYTYTCSFRYEEYMFKIKHAFVYESHFKPLNQPKSCGDLNDNISDAPI